MEPSKRMIYILFFFTLISFSVHSQSFTSFEDFKATIIKFVEQQVDEKPGEKVKIKLLQLNPSMQAPSCSRPIDMKLSQQGISSNSNMVTLTCQGNLPWQLFVPLQIKILVKVLAAAHMIKPGNIITTEDIIEKETDKNLLYDGYFTSIEDVKGHMASRFIPASGVFARKNIKRIPLIKPKQKVDILLKYGSIQIRMRGVAQSNGFLNEEVKILNPSSKKIISATVTGEGVAEMVY